LLASPLGPPASGGSVSFFPDWYNLPAFDHLTLNANFIEKQGHITEVLDNSKHRKILYTQSEKLVGEMDFYHILTILIKDDEILMDAPSKIDIGDIIYNNEEERILYRNWLDEAFSLENRLIKSLKAREHF